MTLPSAMMEMVCSTLPNNLKAQLRFSGAVVDKLERTMNTVNYHDVINQTKNRLLDILLELAALFGGAAWELDQYKSLRPVNHLLLQFAGPTALRQTQVTSSLLKFFNLKDLLQQGE